MVLAIAGALFAFVAVMALILALTNSLPGRSVEHRLNQLRSRTETYQIENVMRTDSGTFPLLRRLLSGSSWSETASLQLAQAGWTLKVSEYALLRLLLTVAPAGLAALIFRGASLGILIVVVAGALGFILPARVLQHYRSRRVAEINAQLAETLSLISNSLRSGFAFTQSVELAARQIGSPIQDELMHFLRDIGLGAPTDTALQAMADRSGSYDLDMMVATILVQRSTGGNLSEVLDNVADTIRERERIATEIQALTASQRLTGLILSVYPVFLAALFYLLAPSLMSVLWNDSVGRIMLALALTLQVIGILTIRRILRPEV